MTLSYDDRSCHIRRHQRPTLPADDAGPRVATLMLMTAVIRDTSHLGRTKIVGEEEEITCRVHASSSTLRRQRDSQNGHHHHQFIRHQQTNSLTQSKEWQVTRET